MKQRLQSLDILRGLTVALMILVNNGAGSEHFETLCHSKWNGMTVCDLVFPSFLFMVGVSVYLAFRKSNYAPTSANLKKVMKRTAELFSLGVALHIWGKCVDNDFFTSSDDSLWTQLADLFANLRIWGVLQRIALCYMATALLSFYVNHKYFWHIICGLLAGYAALLLVGNGYAYDSDVNILSIADKAIFGWEHLYHKSPVDPEGLLGTIPSIAHTMLGFLCGKIVLEKTENDTKLSKLLLFSVSLIWIGYILHWILPLNKRIWSPSYTLLTCGLVSSMLAILIYNIDFKSRTRCFKIFTVMGIHAFTIYIMAEMLEPVFGHWGIKDAIFDCIHSAVSMPQLASAIYASSFVLFIMLIARVLYRKMF